MNALKYLSLGLFCILPSELLYAQSKSLSMGLYAGTIGPGGQFSIEIKDQPKTSNMRILGTYSKYNIHNSEILVSNIQLEAFANITLGGIGMIYDWHPFANSFKISAGVFYSMLKLNGQLKMKDTLTVGEIQITPEEVGSAIFELKPSSIMPYIGIGYGKSVPKLNRFNINFELGTYYSHQPQVNLKCTGLIEPTQDQIGILKSNLKSYQWIPNLSISLNYRLNK